MSGSQEITYALDFCARKRSQPESTATFPPSPASSMIGNAPVPVPMTSRWHLQGISSSMDSGVCPKASRNFLDGFFLRLRTWPRSITTSCS